MGHTREYEKMCLSLARKTLQLVQWRGGGEQGGCGGKVGCRAQLGSSESPWQSCIAADERERGDQTG